jgi:hypothetical protein
MGSLGGFLAGAGAVVAAGAVVVALHRYGDAILRWLAGLRCTQRARQPQGYIPLMGPPDRGPRRPLNAPDVLPEPPPRLAGTPPPGEAGWPDVHLELSRDGDGVRAAVSTSGRQVATFAVDTLGGLSVLGADDLLAELQQRGSLTDLMEQLHWTMPTEDLLAEVSRRAQRP